MTPHRYAVGSVVYLQYSDGGAITRTVPFTVEAQLPPVGTAVQYRIKTEGEAFPPRRSRTSDESRGGRRGVDAPPCPPPAFSGEQD